MIKTGSLKNLPEIKYQAFFYVEGTKVKYEYNPMTRRSGYTAPEGSYTIQDRKSGCHLYYCGDIDPEGLEIADRVLARGAGKIFPWRMTVEDYYRSMSNEMLTDKRLNRLDKIANLELRELAKRLKAEKKAGYQEHLIDFMVEDIKEPPKILPYQEKK
ncbi:MAG: DUF2399 domain-containing protein [Lachnospiraceae bacterium]|nr:DUF2399 domain-containing protein [Lachnospiraceae bacterium]